MDSQLFRLNQMSFQHHQQFLANQHHNNHTNNRARQHYSHRQQTQTQVTPTTSSTARQLTGATSLQQPLASSSSTASDSQDEPQAAQLSSLSTAAASNKSTNSSSSTTGNSQAAILAPGHKSSSQMQREHQMMRQQHQQQQQQRHHHHHHHHNHQQQVVTNVHGGAGHRQAALQAHSLTAPGQQHATKSTGAHHKSQQQLSSSDQLTSSSDQTIDDLHHLAPHSHAYNHRHALTASRFDGGQTVAGASASASSQQSGNRFLLGVLFTLAELLLFASVLLWLYWAYQHDDGLAWQTDRKQQFNTHAALMLFGFIFLSGQAMLIHRSFSCCSKIYTKIMHTILFVLATSAISLGVILAYTAQENVGPNNKPIMHFYSLHAWCGLTTVGLFVFQFVFGFVSFLILLCCDQATARFRAALLPIHKTFGLIIFSLAVATCLTGLLQTARSRLSSKLGKSDYHELAESGIIINLIGCCLICLAILMPYIIRNLDIERSFRSKFDRHLNKLSHLDMRI